MFKRALFSAGFRPCSVTKVDQMMVSFSRAVDQMIVSDVDQIMVSD